MSAVLNSICLVYRARLLDIPIIYIHSTEATNKTQDTKNQVHCTMSDLRSSTLLLVRGLKKVLVDVLYVSHRSKHKE
jgi:hypothetical protein